MILNTSMYDVFIVIFFGSEKIPELARGLAKTMNEIKNASNEIKHEIRKKSTEVEDSKNNKSNN